MHLTMPEKQEPGKKRYFFFLLVPLLAFAALYWWYEAGKLVFEARFSRPAMPVTSPRQGRLLSLEVKEGQSVRQGEILARLDDAALYLRVREEGETLARLALTLPPEYLRLPASSDSEGREESLSLREQRRRLTEEEARSRLEAATDREAQAAVLASRARLRASSRGISAEQLALAEAALEEARAEMRAAREEFERLSLTRAESSADIRRLKEWQLNSGASRLPVESRLAAYEQARQKLAESEAALAAAIIRAPHDGRIAAVYAGAGEEIAAGGRILDIMPARAPGFFEGRISAEQAEKLRPGQRCRLELAGERAKNLEGAVYSLFAAPAGPKDEPGKEGGTVLVRVLPLPAPLGAPQPEEGARAGVTVFLREQVLDPSEAKPASEGRAQRHGTDGSETASGNMPGQAAGKASETASPAGFFQGEVQSAGHDPAHNPAHGQAYESGPSLAVPPPQPLSVQNSFGGEDPHSRPARSASPPKVKAGSVWNGQERSGTGAPGAGRHLGREGGDEAGPGGGKKTGTTAGPGAARGSGPKGGPESGSQAGRAEGKAVPKKDILPPMIAPGVLTGSPLPDKDNNPSIVRPQDSASDKP